MSRVFSAIQLQPYQGLALGQPIALCTPPKVDPRALVFTVDWNSLGAISQATLNRGVSLNLQQGTTQALDAIRGVFIDNTQSGSNIYVQFPDTGMVIVCPAGNTKFSPVMTNSPIANVYILGLVTQVMPTTRIHFMNVSVNPYSDNEANSIIPYFLTDNSNPSSFTSATYGPDTLGQKLVEQTVSLALAGNSAIILPAQPATVISWWHHVKAMRAWAFNCASAGAASNATVQLVNGATVLKNFEFVVDVAGKSKFLEGATVFEMSDMDFLLNGKNDTKIQTFVATGQQGFLELTLCYSSSGSGPS